MQANILWTGREYYSLENCLVNFKPENIEINSTIIGYYQNTIYLAKYLIKTTKDWETFFVDIKYRINNKENTIRLEKDFAGNWLSGDDKDDRLKDCIDVDISITPFTNTLPINRLKLSKDAEQKIKVVYINILEEEINSVEQSYQCLSATKYLYKNVPNNFEAEITVDESGFVIDYPLLFERTACIKTM
jgi:uncharacterized protein